MKLLGLQGGIYITDGNAFASGGEGSIYRLSSHRNLMAKVYNTESATAERFEKLRLMMGNPPNGEALAWLAWPVDVLMYNTGSFAGFVMPALKTDKALDDIYLYNETPDFDLRKRIILGINICEVIEEVHKTGAVFGDFNPSNIGVSTENGHTAFFDVDSFHVDNRRGNGKFYRTTACLPGYAAPEVLKTCRKCERDTGSRNDVYLRADLPTFTFWTDYFALAIHIFRLLFNGFNPYSGVSNKRRKSSKALATGDIAVENDQYCFKSMNKPANLLVPPLNVVPEEIGTLFRRAFIDGKDFPQKRPVPSEWKSVLFDYKKKLVPCKDKASHYYYSKLPNCVWCEADAKFKSKTPWPANWGEDYSKQRGFNASWKNLFGSINEL